MLFASRAVGSLYVMVRKQVRERKASTVPGCSVTLSPDQSHLNGRGSNSILSSLLGDGYVFCPYYMSSSPSFTGGKRLRPSQSVTMIDTTFSQLDNVTFETVNGEARTTGTDGVFSTES